MRDGAAAVLVQRCLRCDYILWADNTDAPSYEVGARVSGACTGTIT